MVFLAAKGGQQTRKSRDVWGERNSVLRSLQNATVGTKTTRLGPLFSLKSTCSSLLVSQGRLLHSWSPCEAAWGLCTAFATASLALHARQSHSPPRRAQLTLFAVERFPARGGIGPDMINVVSLWAWWEVLIPSRASDIMKRACHCQGRRWRPV